MKSGVAFARVQITKIKLHKEHRSFFWIFPVFEKLSVLIPKDLYPSSMDPVLISALGVATLKP